MKPAGRPGRAAATVLVVLVGLAVAPGMIGRVAATDVDHGWAASDSEWWILNEDDPNHNIPDFSIYDELALSDTKTASDGYAVKFSVGW